MNLKNAVVICVRLIKHSKSRVNNSIIIVIDNKKNIFRLHVVYSGRTIWALSISICRRRRRIQQSVRTCPLSVSTKSQISTMRSIL